MVTAAVAKIREGLAELMAADPASCSNDDLGAAVLAVSDAASRLTAQEARLVREFDTRRAYREDACVGAAGWLRFKTNLGPGAAKRRVARAKLLATDAAASGRRSRPVRSASSTSTRSCIAPRRLARPPSPNTTRR